MVERAKEGIKRKATSTEIYGEMQAAFIEIDKPPVNVSLYLHVLQNQLCMDLKLLFIFFEFEFKFPTTDNCG